MSRLIPLLLAALAAAGCALLLVRAHLARRQRDRLIARIATRISAATNGGDWRDLVACDLLEDEVARVLRVYGQAAELGARVAELEAERVLARLAAKGELGGENELIAEREPATAGEPSADGERAVNGEPASGLAPADAALILDQARRLTESSFVAGSDALVRVRAALKNLKDWRQRLGRDEEGGSPPGSNGDSAPGAKTPPESAMQTAPGTGTATAGAFAAVFASLSADVAHLAECAQALRPLAAAAEALAGLAPGGAPGTTAAVPSWDIAAATPARSRHLLLTALRVRSLAAELETGLAGIGTELRVLGRVLAAKPIANAKGRNPGREGPDPAFVRTLSRLETQLTEVAADIAGLTRDAEHLSRELARIRLAANGRPVP
jgi:hypothetical protein